MAVTGSALGSSSYHSLMIDICSLASSWEGGTQNTEDLGGAASFRLGICTRMNSASQEGPPSCSMKLGQTHTGGMTIQGLPQVWVESQWDCHFEQIGSGLLVHPIGG